MMLVELRVVMCCCSWSLSVVFVGSVMTLIIDMVIVIDVVYVDRAVHSDSCSSLYSGVYNVDFFFTRAVPR